MRRLLLTAFGPFPSCPVNPTERLARALAGRLGAARQTLAGWSIDVRVLETAWTAPDELLASIRGDDTCPDLPDLVISLGVRGGSDRIHVERVAYNEAGSTRVDVSGRLAPGAKLLPGARDRLDGMLHRGAFGAVVEAARAAGHPVDFSDDAGRYLCNALFFRLVDLAARLREPETPNGSRPVLGFVHVPHLAGVTAPDEAPNTRDESQVVEALEALVVGWCRAVESTDVELPEARR